MHIIPISSHGAFKAFQGFGIYNASKFAEEGFSEALAIEVAPLGIKVTLIKPGSFRTDFTGNSFRQADAIIDNCNKTAGGFRQRMKAVDDKQEGNAMKVLKVTFYITSLVNLPLGKMAIASLTAKLGSVTKDLNNFKTVGENSVYE